MALHHPCTKVIGPHSPPLLPTYESYDPMNYVLPVFRDPNLSQTIKTLEHTLDHVEQECNTWKLKAAFLEQELSDLRTSHTLPSSSSSSSSSSSYHPEAQNVSYSSPPFKTSFCCFVCAETYQSQNELNDHCKMSGHYCCRTCTRRNNDYKMFETKKQLVYHLKNFHTRYE